MVGEQTNANISDYENEYLVNKKLAEDKAAIHGKSTWAFNRGRQQILVTAEKIKTGVFRTHVTKIDL